MRIALSLSLAFLAVQAYATPVYYSFSGTVYSSTSPAVPNGQAVTYIMMADRDAPGIYTYNGTTYTLTDYLAGPVVDYFQSEYVGGSAMAADLPSSTTYEFRYGMDYDGYGSQQAILYGVNQDHSGYEYVAISGPGLLSSWTVGQGGFRGLNQSRGDAAWYDIQSDLTLQSISSENPLAPAAVPEPGTLALLGLGALALIRLRKRRA